MKHATSLVPALCVGTHCPAAPRPDHGIRDAERRRLAFPRRAWERAGTPSTFRHAITLTEVLISLGILTLGLLGVAALFPVGSYYMQRGETADHGSALAQAAFNEAVARGVLNPENWIAWEDTGVYGQSGTLTRSLGAIQHTFTRRFADMLRKQKADQRDWPAAVRQQYTTREFGSVYVIDPIGISSFALPSLVGNLVPSSDTSMKLGAVYPAGFQTILASPTARQWTPWVDPNPPQGPNWPIRRVTLIGYTQGTVNTPLTNRRFGSIDDLALEMPGPLDRPSIQRFEMAATDLNGDGNLRNDPLSRQYQGDYSWLATVAPTTAEARDALGTDPSAHFYEVSVVVFHKRPLGAASPRNQSEMLDNLADLRANERPVRAKIVSSGLSGGEVLLERSEPPPPTGPEESPFENLRTGHWIFLCGPHPNSTDERPMIVARWYRVLSIEENQGGAITDPTNQRLVALRGPQWPWQPAPSTTGYNDHLSNALYACIPTGAVAVHAKTIRLEGDSVWSGGATGVAGSPPPGSPFGVGY